ncbi:hypothetical protein ACH42_07305 [Endozoicomonas sp. (ex Bugula neritina AB1)]|nr:hypothetical protein ACH42_07305 [Endozoicomonas sp. (ex Bugula neritina AB1)]
MRSGNVYRYGKMLLVGVAMVVILLAADQGRKLILSGLYNHQTEQYLSFWSGQQNKEHFTVSARNLEVAMAGAEKGIELLPDSAEQYVLKARLLWWAEHYTENGETPDTNRAAILKSWQAAVRLRPSWPYSWTEYGMALAQQSIIDERFAAALTLANQQGPWERDVLEASATVGKHYQGWLSPALTETLQASTERLIQLYSRRAKQMGVYK